MSRRTKQMLAAAVAIVCLCGGPLPPLLAVDEVAPAVKLTIDYGDGVEKTFTQLAWREDMTILDLMEIAREHPRGIQFSQRGTGATVFLTSIDGVENEGGRGDNWIFWRNEVQGDRSIGILHLQKGDRVLWKFGKYR